MRRTRPDPLASPTRPLRIGLVSRQYPPESIGGIGTYVRAVAAALTRAGHTPVIIHTAPGIRRETTWDGGIRVERHPAVGPERLWTAMAGPSVRLTSRLRAAVSAFRAVRAHEPFDVIEAPEWKAEGLLLRWARRGPVVVHLHLSNHQVFTSNRERPGFGTRAANALERWSARLAHGVTASSSISLGESDGLQLLPRDRVHLVAPPAPVGRWDEVRPVETTEPTVLCIGRLERLKAPETVVAALAELPPIPDLEVVFVGRPYASASGDPYDVHLRRLAADAGINCEILPPTADIDRLLELLGQARVVAVPSRFETLSMVALEAMAAGRPVVLSSRAGLAELLPDRPSMPIVDPDDVSGWARSLHRFLTDPTAAAAAGARNRAIVRQLAEDERVVDSRVDVYRRVIARTARASPPPAPAAASAQRIGVRS